MTPVDQAIARVRAVYGRWRRDTTIEAMRADWDALFAPDAVPLVCADGVDAAWVCAPGSDARATILYLHGGGFRIGSTRSHHRLMADLSRASGMRVLGVDYRRVPEHPFPAAIEDTLSAWHWLRDGQGLAAHEIAIAGDSAGGNLALQAMLRLRDAGEALPAAALLMSAWTDLTASGDSFVTRADDDPIHSRAMILHTAAGYLQGAAYPADPAVSPLYADLTGLPPMLLQVGERETVSSDTTDFAARARAAGVPAIADVWAGMIHVFQQFPDILPDAAAAIDSGGAFLRRHMMETTT